MKKLSKEQIDALIKPLPSAAISQHPTKKFLSSIKNIFVAERLNQVFGFGGWSLTSEVMEATGKMIVLKVTMLIPEYEMSFEHFGGNDNADRGDAYKGAVSDALTKIAAQHLGVGQDVFKGEQAATTSSTKRTAPDKPWFNDKELAILKKGYEPDKVKSMKAWISGFTVSKEMKEKINAIDPYLKNW